MNLTFPQYGAIMKTQGMFAGNKHSLRWRPNTYISVSRGINPQPREPSARDRRLTSSFGRAGKARGTQCSPRNLRLPGWQGRKSKYMYSPFREIFPARAIHTPPFRTRGMTGNRLFNRSPSTNWPKLNCGRWIPQFYCSRHFSPCQPDLGES